MKSRPILFSQPMVRAIREGLKTQTRRAVKPGVEELIRCHAGEPGDECDVSFRYNTWFDDDMNEHGPEWLCYASEYPEEGVIPIGQCPYGQPGDRLYVKEPWKTERAVDHLPPRDLRCGAAIYYLADGEPDRAGRYRHARFMPRWASRILLGITDIRIERLQEISAEDAEAEGIVNNPLLGCCQCPWGIPGNGKSASGFHLPIDAYRALWESINGPGSWQADPWVWVVTFRVLDLNVGRGGVAT